MEIVNRIYSFMDVKFNNVKITTKIVQPKIGKVLNNTGSTTKLSFINELGVTVKHSTATPNSKNQLQQYVPFLT